MVADLFYFRTDFDPSFLFRSWQPERNSISLLTEEIQLHCLLTEYARRKVHDSKQGLELNRTQLQVHAGDINLLDESKYNEEKPKL